MNCHEMMDSGTSNETWKPNFNAVSEELQASWLSIQEKLKQHMILEDTELWQKLRQVYILPSKGSNEVSDGTDSSEDDGSDASAQDYLSLETHEREILTEDKKEGYHTEIDNKSTLKYVGGVDISYIKDSEEDACIAVVILSLPDLKVVHECCELVKVTTPYIPGFLGFREAELARDVLVHIKYKSPEYFPQVILVDGNGILHPRGFGFACHLGVLLDIPSIGVAKNLYHIDGIERNEDYKRKISELKKAGDLFYLEGTEKGILGAALKTCDSATKPVYVSQGHRCSLETAIWIVKMCSKYRRPEPVRQADMVSREYLRNLAKREHDTHS